MAILVTGGAGYIGSVTVEALAAAHEEIVVLDNLVRGHADAVADGIPFYEGDVADTALVKTIIAAHNIDACIHFAAFAYVGESVSQPAKYFENNTVKTNALLNTLLAAGVNKVVFSSTCATYGDPQYIPIDEDHPQQPVNPYGWSKFMTERILDTYSAAYDMRSVALRYFNAAGATVRCGERHDPEPHLIPNVLAAAAGGDSKVSVFGSDYDTTDGTCIRDYIHVSDLADAHIRAVGYLRDGGCSTHINLGNGSGSSVLDIIRAAERVTGRTVPFEMMPRRAGDPAVLIADAEKARKTLGWQPKITEIDEIIASAWKFFERGCETI